MKWLCLECLLLLCYPAIDDIRRKQFNIVPIAILQVIFVILNIFLGMSDIKHILYGCIPGCILFLISVWTKEMIGKGDALIAICIGMIMGWQRTGELLMISLVLCGISGLFLVVLRKAGKKTEIAFVPFLLMAVVMISLV